MHSKIRTPWMLSAAAIAVLGFGLVAAACGNDDDDGLSDDGVGNGFDNGVGDGTDDGVGNSIDDGLNGDDVGNGTGVEDIRISGMTLEPPAFAVTTGTTVTVTNDDSAPHVVMVNGETEGELDPGESLDITFDEPGDHEVTTDVHAMAAVVVTVN